MKPTVPDILQEAAKTFTERHVRYGDNYKFYGQAMKGIFPQGIHIDSPEAMMRLGLIHNILTKLTRYAQNLNGGGHKDSAHDACIYAAMLEEMTDE